jgi:uncharacterized membrane protein
VTETRRWRFAAAGFWIVAVYPANVHIAIRPKRFPKYPPALLSARLPYRARSPG